MKTNHCKTLLIVCALVLAMVLSGCGGSAPQAEATVPETTVMETTAATESPEEIAYREAEALFAQEDWEGAAAAFEALGDYADAADRASDARSQIVTVVYSQKFWWGEESMQPEGSGEIHDFTLQELSNGKIRFVIDYTMLEGREIVCFDPPNGDKVHESYGLTAGGRDTLTVDFDRAFLEATPELTFNFYSEQDGAYFCALYTDDVIKFLSTKHAPQNPNAEVLRSEEMEFYADQHKEKIINGYTLQELSDGYIRFVIDCTMPKGVNITAFNPPNGDMVSKYLGRTEGGQCILTVDIEKYVLEAIPDINFNFWDEANGPFFASVATEDIAKFVSGD